MQLSIDGVELINEYPIKLVENLYISYGADGSDYIICTENNVVIYFIADGHSQRSGSADLIRLFIDYMNNHLPHENLTKFNVKQKFVSIYGYLRKL